MVETWHIGHDGLLIGFWSIHNVWFGDKYTTIHKTVFCTLWNRKSHCIRQGLIPSASSILGMSRNFSAISKAVLRLPIGSSCKSRHRGQNTCHLLHYRTLVASLNRQKLHFKQLWLFTLLVIKCETTIDSCIIQMNKTDKPNKTFFQLEKESYLQN